MKSAQKAYNAERNQQVGEFDSRICPEGVRVQNLAQAKDQSSQYAISGQQLYEKNDIIDASGTRDLRSRWEKSKKEGDVVVDSGGGSGQFAVARFQGLDEATADGTANHNITKFTREGSELIDDRLTNRLSASEQTVFH